MRRYTCTNFDAFVQQEDCRVHDAYVALYALLHKDKGDSSGFHSNALVTVADSSTRARISGSHSTRWL